MLTYKDSAELSKIIHEVDTNSLISYMFALCSTNVGELVEEDLRVKEIVSKELKLRTIHPNELCG